MRVDEVLPDDVVAADVLLAGKILLPLLVRRANVLYVNGLEASGECE